MRFALAHRLTGGPPNQVPPTPDEAWTPELLALRQRIEAHAFDPDHALSFTRRLARDHRWTLPYAQAAIREYGRFCFLAVTAAMPMTPSEEVDEVWHLHLTYTRDYWDEWCHSVLRTKLHHDPTQGGPAEQRRFMLQYAQTLHRYERFFGPPPVAYWPGTDRRFHRHPRYRVRDTARWR